MSMRLTETERRVAEMYARGLRPREIAEKLGISINTVYKALSKARKLAAIADKPEPRDPPSLRFRNFGVYVPHKSRVLLCVYCGR
jgi:transposase